MKNIITTNALMSEVIVIIIIIKVVFTMTIVYFSLFFCFLTLVIVTRWPCFFFRVLLKSESQGIEIE
eukprot:03807.XXX_6803_7003_1 [CDS] Oithona nana genome sequencing.